MLYPSTYILLKKLEIIEKVVILCFQILKPVLLEYRLIKAIPNTALLVGSGFTGKNENVRVILLHF